MVFFDESPFWSNSMAKVHIIRQAGTRYEEVNLVPRCKKSVVKINLFGVISWELGLKLAYSVENMNGDRYATLIHEFI
jgi:hypothetical protein